MSERIPLGRYVVAKPIGRGLLNVKTVDVTHCSDTSVRFRRPDGQCFGMNIAQAKRALAGGEYLGKVITDVAQQGGTEKVCKSSRDILNQFAGLDDKTKDVLAESAGRPFAELESLAERNAARQSAEEDGDLFDGLF